MKYFVVSWSAEIEFFVGKYCERISWNIFLERLLLASKSFSTFGNIVSQEYIGLKFLGNNYTISNRVILEKGIILTHRFYFLIAQAFFSLIKKYYTRFYLKKISKIFLIIGFSKQSRVWASIEKKNRAFVSVVESFQSWHIRTSLYLAIAWIRSIVVRCSLSSLSSELSSCQNWQFGRYVTRS